MHETRVLVFVRQCIDTQGRHGAGVGRAVQDAVVLCFAELEVIEDKGPLCAPGQNEDDVLGVLGGREGCKEEVEQVEA